MPSFLTVKDVAKILNVHEVTVRLLIKESKLPAQKTGLKWLISEKVLSDFIDNGRRTNG